MVSHESIPDKGGISPAPTAGASSRGGDSGTVNRVLRLLSCLSEQDRWGLNDLARALSLPKATAHRLLGLCKPLGFVTQGDDGMYRPGLALYRLAGKLASEMPLHRLATPILHDLRDRTDETVMLALLDRSELQMYFSMSASPAHPLRYAIQHNRLQPLSWGAPARSMLAFLPPEDIDAVVRRAEPSPLNGRPLVADELLAALDEIRQQGYALSYAERAPEVHGIAVPFFDNEGQVKGNLTLTVPDFRFDASQVPGWVALLREGASEVSLRMGWL